MTQVIDSLCIWDHDLALWEMETEDWQKLQHILFFLHPFAAVTTFMSGQTYPTVSSIIVFFNAIMDHVERFKSSELPSIVRTAAKESFKKLKQYYNKTSKMNCIVTLLDPRCNLSYFRKDGFTKQLMDPFLDK